jgi:hydrogenase-4 component F
MILLAILAAPLAAALVAGVAPGRRLMELANLGAFALVFLLACRLALRVLEGGPVSAWSEFFYADSLSAVVVLLTAFVTLLCGIYGVGYFRRRPGAEALSLAKLREFYCLTPLFAFTMLLVALANNLGLMWVALEGTTLASLLLIAFYNRATSLEAAWKYAIIGGVGLSLALFGTIVTYYAVSRISGSLNWSALAVQAARLDRNTMRLGFILILLGYGTKAGLAPMHTWKPDAYSEAPVPAAAMLAAAVVNCAVYGIVRFAILAGRCLGPDFPSGLLILFGLLSMAVAVPFILVQRNFLRLLAYSSIDQTGIMILGIGFGGQYGALGALLHMTFHSVVKPMLFFCAGNVQQQYRTDVFRKVKSGLIHSMPVTGAAFLLGALAVTGAPPFSLFQSEFLVLSAAFQAGSLFAAALFVISVVAIFSGFLLHIGKMVLGPPPASPDHAAVSVDLRHFAVASLAALVFVLAFWLPLPLYRLIQDAARIAGGR